MLCVTPTTCRSACAFVTCLHTHAHCYTQHYIYGYLPIFSCPLIGGILDTMRACALRAWRYGHCDTRRAYLFPTLAPFTHARWRRTDAYRPPFQ